MRRIFFFLFLIVAVWVGIEVMNHGMAGAFGGLFARAGSTAPAPEVDESLPKRAGRSVDSALRAGEARVERSTSE